MKSEEDLIKIELEKVRKEKQPSKRGILICGKTMGDMLKLGWRVDQLDSLELLFWMCRDADGRLLDEKEISRQQ